MVDDHVLRNILFGDDLVSEVAAEVVVLLEALLDDGDSLGRGVLDEVAAGYLLHLLDDLNQLQAAKEVPAF